MEMELVKAGGGERQKGKVGSSLVLTSLSFFKEF